MKKILMRMMFVAVALGFFLVCLLYVIVHQRYQNLANQKPFSAEKFEQLAGSEPAHMNPAEPNASSEIPRLTTTLPGHLKNLPSPETLAGAWKFDERMPYAAAGAVTNVVESALWSLGARPTASRWAGLSATHRLAVGDFEGARQYLEAALEAPVDSYYFRSTCASLAWLQDDPKEATRLLALSCRDDATLTSIVEGIREKNGSTTARTFDNFMRDTIQGLAGEEMKEMSRTRRSTAVSRSLQNAVALCRVTESGALAEHYLERLRIHDPEIATQFESGVSANIP